MNVFSHLSSLGYGEVHFSRDAATGLAAIIAIHDTRLGPSLGGCRFIHYDTEEAAVQLADVVPFLVEEELKRLGGIYEKAADWQSFTIVDGRLITGQNPASSQAAAEQLVRMLA